MYLLDQKNSPERRLGRGGGRDEEEELEEKQRWQPEERRGEEDEGSTGEELAAYSPDLSVLFPPSAASSLLPSVSESPRLGVGSAGA